MWRTSPLPKHCGAEISKLELTNNFKSFKPESLKIYDSKQDTLLSGHLPG
jgi:hypothetical protein